MVILYSVICCAIKIIKHQINHASITLFLLKDALWSVHRILLLFVGHFQKSSF